MLDWRLTTGFFPIALLAVALAGLGWLLYRREPGWWRRQVPIAIAIGVVVAIASKIFVDRIWRPWPDPLPLVVPLGVGVTTTALILAILHPMRWPMRFVAGLTVLIIGLGSAAQVNDHFEYYQTVRQLLGLKAENHVDFGAIPRPTVAETSSPTSQPLATPRLTASGSAETESTTTTTPSTAEPPPPPSPAPPSAEPPMPTAGVVTEANIPGSVSGFVARNAFIYLPPAYGLTADPLPVLILMAGQPGHPLDWINGGKVDQTMNDFAAGHDGLAPVVVIVDQLGDELANPLCVDSARGNSFTYLTVDVPAWIKQNLIVDGDPQRWAVGGMSSGGTCALQLAVNAPAIYPTFIDISGQDEPTLGTHDETVDEIFGGDEMAFWRVNPMDLLHNNTFPDTAGVIAVGADDPDYKPEALRIAKAAQDAGMSINYFEVPGGHTFDVWAAQLAQAMPWLAARLGLPA